MSATERRPFDPIAIRAEFPASSRRVNGAPLIYLDHASTTQKPRAVIDAIGRAYEATANVHRGVHALSVETTRAFEAVREKSARLLHAGRASDPREIIFVRGTTEALNLVAQSYGRANVQAGDEVLVTELEHHSNIVPWQMLCAEKRAKLVVLPIDDRGEIRLDLLSELLTPKTRIVALAHISNSLGTVLPVSEIAARAHDVGAIVVVDGAQAVAHRAVDVAALDCDFYAFSAHKLYGPTGAGVLWGKRALLDAMPPWQFGGDMIASVRFEETTFADVPHRFEAGTPDIVSVIGMGAAIDWLSAIGFAEIEAHEQALLAHATKKILTIEDVRVIGSAREKSGILSFNVGAIHPHDIGTALDLEGIAVRTGHHCTEPAMLHFGIDGTVRASFGVATTEADIDALALAVEKARSFFANARTHREL